jgi:nucleotide-binding universal stress UspA family protein
MFERRLEFGSNSVLFATDLSSASETAMAYAVRFARRYNAKIMALQVFDYALAGSPRTGGLPCGLADMRSDVEETMQDLKTDLCKEHVRHEVTLIDGNPASEILRTIGERNVDLAILGTHAKEGWERVARGSVAEEVLRKAHCPVLTVGPRVSLPQQRELLLRNLLFATDFSSQSLMAMPYAVAIANDFNACLHLLHILPPSMTENSDRERATDRLRETLKHLNHLRTEVNCVFKYDFDFNDRAAEGILAQAATDCADLIILGVNRASQLAPHLPNITSHIIGKATCPVLTISS